MQGGFGECVSEGGKVSDEDPDEARLNCIREQPIEGIECRQSNGRSQQRLGRVGDRVPERIPRDLRQAGEIVEMPFLRDNAEKLRRRNANRQICRDDEQHPAARGRTR